MYRVSEKSVRENLLYPNVFNTMLLYEAYGFIQ